MAQEAVEKLVKAISAHETSEIERPEDIKACETWIGKLVKAVYTPQGIDKDENSQKTVRMLMEEQLLKSILYHMPEFSPKVRQDIRNIWLITLKSEKLREEVDNHFRMNPELLILLVRGYTKKDMVQTYGDILRFCIKHEAMLYLILFSSLVWQFFKFVTADEYEKCSDAFKTFKTILTRNNPNHKKHVAKFLKTNFDEFFRRFTALLEDDRYHVKRQSLRVSSLNS